MALVWELWNKLQRLTESQRQAVLNIIDEFLNDSKGAKEEIRCKGTTSPEEYKRAMSFTGDSNGKET